MDIAAEQLLTSDPEISDDLLWLLAFYYNPCNESQSRGRTMVGCALKQPVFGTKKCEDLQSVISVSLLQ